MVYVQQLDAFVMVMLLEETLACLPLWKLCEDHGHTNHWTSGQKPHHQKGHENWLQYIKLCAIRGSWFIWEFLCNAHTYFIIIFITGFKIWRKQIHWKSSTRKKWKCEWRAVGRPAARNHRNRKKWGTRRCTKRYISWIASLANRALEETQSKEGKTLPSHLMNFQWHREKTWNRVRVSLVSTRNFWTKRTRASCRSRAGTVVPRAEHFVTWSQRITKFSVKDVNRVTIIDMPWFIQDLTTQWLQSYPCETKTSQETQKSPMKFLERHGNHKSFTLTIPWNLASLSRNEPGIVVRQHRTDQKQMGLLKEQCAESKKGHLPYSCNHFWTKNGGWIPWNVTAICETFKISCLMGNTLWKAVRNALWRTRNTVWSNGRISTYFCEGHIAITWIWSNSLTRYIPWICVVRRRNLEKRHNGRRHLRKWRRWTHPRPKAQCKGSVNANERWNFHLPSRR